MKRVSGKTLVNKLVSMARELDHRTHAVRDRHEAASEPRDEPSQQDAWSKHPPHLLEQYMVSGYQNPRINVQSMLARHVLIRKLVGPELDRLLDEELQFSAQMNRELRDHAGTLGVEMGSFLDEARFARVKEAERAIADRVATFERRIARRLLPVDKGPLSVLELGCGAANDYRFFHSYGLARLLDYRGLDASERVIASARARRPEADFRVGTAAKLPDADASYDFVIAFDLFEHLPLEELHQAVAEAARVSRCGLVIACSSTTDADRHEEGRKHGSFHHRLSVCRLTEALRAHYRDVDVVHIASLMSERYDYPHVHNRRAYSFVAEGKR